MSARTHVCAALLLTSFSVTGCLFGGGDKKAAPQAARPESIDADDDGIVAGAAGPGNAEHSVSYPPEISAAARTQQAIGAAQAADAAVERALSPDKASAVEWLDGDSLRLSNALPAERQRAAVAPEPDELEVAVATGSGRADALDAPAASDPAASGTEPAPLVRKANPVPPTPAVANQPLEISESAVPAAASSDAEAMPAAAASAGSGLGDLQRRVGQRFRDNPGDLAAHLDFQLMRYLSDEPVPDLAAIAGLPPEDRELLTALLDGLSNFRNGIRADANLLLSKKIRPLLEMALRIRSQADLSIKTIALCEEVLTFGSYTPLDGRFVAGDRNAVIVYCELSNLSSRQNDRNEWESTPAQEAVLYTLGGQRIWSSTRQSAPDVSRSRRQDFFVAQQIVLPPNLAIGRYILKVTVYDEQVKRMAESSLPIEVVAQLPSQDRPLYNAQRDPSGKERRSQEDAVEGTRAGERPVPTREGGKDPIVRQAPRLRVKGKDGDPAAPRPDAARTAAERQTGQALDALSGSREGDDR